MTRSNLVPEYVKVDFRERTKGVGYFTTNFISNNCTEDQEAIVVHQCIISPYIYAAMLVYDMSQISALMNELLKNSESGLIGFSTSFKPIQSCYESISVWKNVDSIRSFFTGGLHLTMMERWKDYLKIGDHLLTTRFSILQGQLPHDSESTIRFWHKVKNLEFDLL